MKECFRFHESVKKVVVPLNRELLNKRARILGLNKLKPWDTSIDIYGFKPLKPFKAESELVNGCIRILKNVDSRIGANLEYMKKHKLLDLSSRKNKAPAVCRGLCLALLLVHPLCDEPLGFFSRGKDGSALAWVLLRAFGVGGIVDRIASPLDVPCPVKPVIRNQHRY